VSQGAYEVSTRIAAALLLKHGELSLSDIEALPFVEDEEMALAIVGRLRSLLNAEPRQRRIPGTNGAWEMVIELKKPVRYGVAASASR